MTRYCPICESPGTSVVRGEPSAADIRSLQNGSVLRVGTELPGIEPSHFCTFCPTFFRARDRFYLTALQGTGTHGIGVRTHNEPTLRVENTSEGLLTLFNRSTSVLLPNGDYSLVFNDFFRGRNQSEIVIWSRRRGFDLRLAPSGPDRVEVQVNPAGPHYFLTVAKSWFRDLCIRTPEDLMYSLEDIGANPVVFRPQREPLPRH